MEESDKQRNRLSLICLTRKKIKYYINPRIQNAENSVTFCYLGGHITHQNKIMAPC